MLTKLAGWLLSKFGVYLLCAAVAGGGWLYLKHHLAQDALREKQLTAYKRTVQIMKDDLKQDQEDQDEKDRIEALTPEQLPDEFAKLRDRARTKGAGSGDADD